MPIKSSFADSALSLKQQLGQKLMLDLRYFCDQGSSKRCRTPLTKLPDTLAKAISRYDIGGVILFSENASL